MGNLVWKVLGTGSAVLAANVARKGATIGWEKTTGRPTPDKENSDEAAIVEAIAWALVSGAVVGVARMLAERQSAKYFTKSAGHSPAVYEEEKEAEKAAK